MTNRHTPSKSRRSLLKLMLLSPVLTACGGGGGGSPNGSATSAGTPVVMGSVIVNSSQKGQTLDTSFAGFSFEKNHIYVPYFDSNNAALVALFQRLGTGILRIGANSVDKTTWNPSGPGLIPNEVAPADIDRLAGFLKAVNWKAIYGLNFANNTPSAMAAEAAYANQALGSLLYGFELGNEPDLYHSNGWRPSTYTYADFLAEWKNYAAAVSAQVSNAVFTGPAAAWSTAHYSVPFAHDEAGTLQLLTEHYYRASGQDPNSTIELLLQPDPALVSTLQELNQAATSNGIPGGFRLAEANSYYGGGAPNVSDAHGTALWAIDFLFINALYGSAGVNFHTGGSGPGYTPIADNGTYVVDVRPEFYGIYLFSQAARGTLLTTTVNTSGLLLTAYAVVTASGGSNVVIVNKDPSTTAAMTVVLNANASSAALTTLTGPSLSSPTDTVINNATMNSDGSWNPDAPQIVAVTGGQLVVQVPPASAVLIQAS